MSKILEESKKLIAKTIIEYNYNFDHRFLYSDAGYGYDSYGHDNCYIVYYICDKCKYSLQIIFWGICDFHEKFYFESEQTNSDLDHTKLNYFGTSRILNNDKVDIISCNEWMIKKLLE